MALNLLADDELLSEAETAEALDVHLRTLKRWRILAEDPPHIQIGRKIYYRRGAIRQWLLGLEGGQ